MPVRLGLVAGFFFLLVGGFLLGGFDRKVRGRGEFVVHVDFQPIFSDRPTVGRLAKSKVTGLGVAIHLEYCLEDFRVRRRHITDVFRDQYPTDLVASFRAFGFEDRIEFWSVRRECRRRSILRPRRHSNFNAHNPRFYDLKTNQGHDESNDY